MHPARHPQEQFESDLRFEYARSSGPGGQHRNKVDTAVRITHLPTGLRSHAGERRSMLANKKAALKRLRRKLALEHRMPLELSDEDLYEPTALWVSRREGTKLIVSERHEDYSPLLSEALDVIEHFDLDMGRASRVLGLSTGQMVRFLARDPAALARINERRRDRGWKPLTTRR